MNIISRIESIRAREHEATVELIAALVECDLAEAHLEFGIFTIRMPRHRAATRR